MHLPKINGREKYKKQVIVFGGINKTEDFSPGELLCCNGISHIAFPAITQKQKMLCNNRFEALQGADFREKECVCRDNALFYDGKKVGELTSGEKEIVIMGNFILVFPDKAYYNVQTEKFGNLCAEYNISGVKVTFKTNSISVPLHKYVTTKELEEYIVTKDEKFHTYTGVSVNGTSLELSGYKQKSLSELKEGDIFTNRCVENRYRRLVSVLGTENENEFIIRSTIEWTEDVFLKMFDDLSIGDVVEISGCTVPENNKSTTISAKGDNNLTFGEDEFIEKTETADITIKRKIPDFSCACAYENRLWGCEKNVIYASKLGDPFNFFIYKNLSTDSFSVSSNTAGDFTACIPFGSCCIFFKENSAYKLYGNKPSNFQLVECFGGGVPSTCRKSVSASGGKLFYCGNGGIYSFGGGIPRLISQKLGAVKLQNAAAATDGKRYFIAADTGNGRKLFVYDIERNLWSNYGETKVFNFSNSNGKIFAMCTDGVYEIAEEAEENSEWSFELCPFDENYYKTKNYNRLYLCVELWGNAWIDVEIKTDGGLWRSVAKVHGEGKKHINIPLLSHSCHELSIRIKGKGKSLIKSIVREFSVN